MLGVASALAETNGKLDFFTELEWGVEIHILTSHQLAVDQDKCFGLVGEGGSKLSVMLRGISIRLLQSPGRLAGGSNRPSSPGAACVRKTGGGRRRRRGKGHRVNLFFSSDDSLLHPCREDLNQNVNVGASEGSGLWDMLVLIIWSELELLCSTTECVFPRCSVTGITQSSTGGEVCC